MSSDLPDERAQPLQIGRRGQLLDHLTLIGKHAHIQPPVTQIQTNMQHSTLPPSRDRQ